MMILLGLFTGWRAVHSEYYQKGDAADNDSPLPPPPTAGTPLLPPQSSSSSSSGGGGEEKTAAGAGDVEAGGAAAVNASGSGSSKAATWLRGLKERALALVVGCVHGVAGPGGVLGVLPAVELHAWGPAMTYLFSFCITSILVMGAFAGLWGEMSYRLGCVLRLFWVWFGLGGRGNEWGTHTHNIHTTFQNRSINPSDQPNQRTYCQSHHCKNKQRALAGA